MPLQANTYSDTIVALSTPPGFSGIGVIRLSGSRSLELLRSVFSPSAIDAEITNRTAIHGVLIDPLTGRKLDDGIAIFMQGPGSYTGEDVVELSLHGSPVVLDSVVQLLVRLGARPATRGEFTRRAFLAGKLDLVQAEAVIDLIESTGPAAAEEARGRLDQSLSLEIRDISNLLKDIVADMEAHIDFDEDDEEPVPNPESAIRAIFQRMRDLQRRGEMGRVCREGISTVIVGKPNVGKSTLFNALLRTDRMIVTPYAGTTRDTVEERLILGAATFSLCDTAGMRNNPEPIETEGIRRTEERIEAADLVLVVIDGSAPPDDEDATVLAACKGKEVMLVFNKMDLGRTTVTDDPEMASTHNPPVMVSAMTGQGLDRLRDLLTEFGAHSTTPPGGSISGNLNRRCLLLMEAAMIPLREILLALERESEVVAAEIVSLELRRALGPLEEITGERVDEGILDRIFERFCVGK
jgi:tRNA modification GTPase